MTATMADRSNQTISFPGEDFETAQMDEAGWQSSYLDDAFEFAATRNTTQLLVCYKGRIVKESYWDCTADDAGDIYSAQKSIVAVMLGIAQARGHLRISDTVGQHMGAGWSKLTVPDESRVTLKDLMAMTTGMNDELETQGTIGHSWHYNTPAYQILKRILSRVTGRTLDDLLQEWITIPTGMNVTHWVERSYMTDAYGDPATGISTNVRDMARFGLMILGNGCWNGKDIITDKSFLDFMFSSSGTENPAYGHLWWINGQASFRKPFVDTLFKGSMVPSAPDDMISCLGFADQKIYIIPDWSTVIARRGGPGNETELAGSDFDTELWALLAAARTRT